MADRATLRAERRAVLGKKVKRLRNQGILPANVYGRNLESVPLQLEMRSFIRTVRDAGVRSMFELAIDGEQDPRYVIIRGLDRHGGVGDPIHVDFYQVDLNRPVQTNVLVVFTGTAPAVADMGGTLLQNLDYVAVECLPLDIPASIEVDIGVLDSFDKSISVGDLPGDEKVRILTDPSIGVATVARPRVQVEAAEEEAAEEGEEAVAEAPGGEEQPEAAEPPEPEE